ncbi:MAG: 3-oxoacyl-ACP synthase, partial [Betaproteobacteria bacterium]
MIYSRIVGTGSFLPATVVTNADLAARGLDTSDAWIRERTGIRERRIADKSQSSSDLALEASRQALQAADTRAADIDLIVVATSTPDYVFPSTACLLQAKL